MIEAIVALVVLCAIGYYSYLSGKADWLAQGLWRRPVQAEITARAAEDEGSRSPWESAGGLRVAR